MAKCNCNRVICPHNWRGVVLLILLLIVGCCEPAECAEYRGPSWPLSVHNGRHIVGSASAVPIGRRTTPPRTVWLTVRHNFEGGVGGHVSDSSGDQWIPIQAIRKSNRHDVASFETLGDNWPIVELVEDVGPVPDGEVLTLCGFGDSTSARNCFRATYVSPAQAVRADHAHVIPGDSGGAVTADCNGRPVLVGLIRSFDVDSERRTNFVTANICKEYLTQQYGRPPVCTPWGCPPPQNYIRSQRVTPQFLAPPRVEFYEQSTTPSTPITTTPSSPDCDCPPGAQGPRGLQGERGPQGPPGDSPTAEELATIIQRVIDSRMPDLTTIENRLTTLENQKRRVLLVEDGEVLDDESYAADEAIVLDLKRIIRSN